MRRHFVASAALAIGMTMWFAAARATAQDGPILPGLDSLPPAHRAPTPRTVENPDREGAAAPNWSQPSSRRMQPATIEPRGTNQTWATPSRPAQQMPQNRPATDRFRQAHPQAPRPAQPQTNRNRSYGQYRRPAPPARTTRAQDAADLRRALNNPGQDPRTLQRDPRTLQRDPRTLQRDPRTMQRDPRTMQTDPRNPQRGAVDPRDPRRGVSSPNASRQPYPTNQRVYRGYGNQAAPIGQLRQQRQPAQRPAYQTPASTQRRQPIVIRSTPGGRPASQPRTTADPTSRRSGSSPGLDRGASRAGQLFGSGGSGRASMSAGNVRAAPGRRR